MIGWWLGGGVTVAAAVVDARTRTIPTLLMVGGAVGAAGGAALGMLPWTNVLWALGLALLYTVATSAADFGGGDLKLLAVSGLYWGPIVVLVLIGSHLLQFLYTIAANRRHGHRVWTPLPLPWAPFLAAAWLGCTLVVLH